MSKYTNQEQQAIDAALSIIHTKLSQENGLAVPVEMQKYLRIRLACDKDEWLCAMFLNNQYRMISFQRLFRGPVSASSNVLKVVTRKALELNTATVVLCQNHIEGDVVPRDEDRVITVRIREALALFGIQLLDHITLSPHEYFSLAEHELLQSGTVSSG
jgi:DNA repair protein RadC